MSLIPSSLRLLDMAEYNSLHMVKHKLSLNFREIGGASMKDYYLILGINANATTDELKIAFRTLMKVWHPDVCYRNDAYKRFVEIVEAYEVLGDVRQRKEYDEMRKTSTDVTLQQTEKSPTTFFGCLIIIFLIIVSFGFVAFIAYKVYAILHGVNQ